MIINRRALLFAATATLCGFTVTSARAAVELDLSTEEYQLPNLKSYLVDCTTGKGLKLPQPPADILAKAKTAFASKQLTTDAEAFDWVVETLTSAGASSDDARNFSECVRSAMGIYGRIAEGFIKVTYGEAAIRASDGSETKGFVAKNLVFGEGGAFKVNWDEGYRAPANGEIVTVSEIASVPKWLSAATSAVLLFTFVESDNAGRGKTMVEQLYHASAEVFG